MLSAIARWDASVLLALQSLHGSVWDRILSVFTHLGDSGILWIVLAVLLLLFPKTRRAGFLALLAMAVGLLVTNGILKHLIMRSRPYVTWKEIIPLLTSGDPNSFPSGHTSAAFSAGIVWLKTLPWRWARIAAVIVAVLMGFSRLYVGVHYPTDVLAGAVLGSLYAVLVLFLARRWREKHPRQNT